MHTVIIAIGFLLFVTSIVFHFLALHQSIELQDELNKLLPEGEKFEPMFWYFGTHEKFKELHHRMLPDSARPRKARNFSVIAILLFLSSVTTFLVSVAV